MKIGQKAELNASADSFLHGPPAQSQLRRHAGASARQKTTPFMLAIFAITCPIYLIVALGYFITRQGLFAKSDMRVFGKFVITLALPALLLRALTQRDFSEILNSSYLLAYACGSLATLVLGYAYARKLGRQDPLVAALSTMGMCSSNSGFVGYPILLLMVAPIAGVALALNMMVENLLIIPLLLLMAERGRGAGGHPWHVLVQSFTRLAKTPLIQAMLVGLLIALSGWHLPAPLAQTINMFANASGVLSLLVIGGALVGVPVHGMAARVLPVVAGKLLLHPAMVLLCVLALPLLQMPPLDTSMRTAAVLLAAMPMMGIYPTLTQAYGVEDVSAAALLAATVGSFFTLSALIGLLRFL